MGTKMTISKKTFREMLACSPVVFNQFLIGLGYGWTAPSLMKLRIPNNNFMSINEEQASWIASLHEMGKITGPFLSPLVVNQIGRRYGVALITVLLFLIWTSQIYIHTFYLLCLVRLLFGIINGISDVTGSIYVTENCTPKFRAVVGGILSIIYSAGSSVELILATYLTFRTTAIVNTVISTCAFSALYFCTETPSFLIMKEKYYEAERNFRWLRGGVVRAKDSRGLAELVNSAHQQSAGKPKRKSFKSLFSLEKLTNNVQQEKLKQKSFKSLFSSRLNVRSICVVLGMYMLAALSGNSAMNSYSTMIFQPSDVLTAYQYTIIYSITNFISVCVSSIIMSKASRRKLLIISYLLVGLCHLSTSFLFYMQNNRNYEIAFFPWLVYASMTLYGCAISITGPSMFVIRTEILPLSVRALGASTAVVTNGFTSFCVARTFLPIRTRFGIETNFFVYAVMSLLMSALVYLIVPETRGKTLEEINESLEKKSKIKIKPLGATATVDSVKTKIGG